MRPAIAVSDHLVHTSSGGRFEFFVIGGGNFISIVDNIAKQATIFTLDDLEQCMEKVKHERARKN
jgi:hypothetical protein